MPEVSVGGHRVSFRLDGPAEGQVFAFVNGLTQYSDLWAAYADHLAGRGLARIEQENGRLLQTQIRLLKDGYEETPRAERETVVAAKVALVEAAFGRFLDSLAA